MATPVIRRESYLDCDIIVSADEIPTLPALAGGRCIASYLVYCKGEMTHSDSLAENFPTCDEAEAAAFTAARKWIDGHARR
jgi:hypothetical protein